MGVKKTDIKDDLIEGARRVLETEAEALSQLARELPEDFVPTVSAILQRRGHVIVVGIGKSGHVARKIAATLASTGTQAFYIHPAEASHGDLGMISKEDLCILVSNSGETAELGDVIAHCQRFSIPIAGISRKLDSTLMRVASYKLLLPEAPEACSIGMAPTTSTTMAMALGDALAVALMERRNFGAENFHELHPGGQLGARLSRVDQIMHRNEALPLVDHDTNMQETLLIMTSKGFGIAAVTKDQKLIGVISDGDLRRHMDELMDRKAGEIASQNPITMKPDSYAAEALRLMNENEISVLLITDKDHLPVGILHIHDLLRKGVV